MSICVPTSQVSIFNGLNMASMVNLTGKQVSHGGRRGVCLLGEEDGSELMTSFPPV